MPYHYNDCPAPVRKELERLVKEFRDISGRDLVGVYLHGSLALGCFNPLRSDLDLLAVTQQGLGVEAKRQLGELFLEVSGSPSPIEISFLIWKDLFPWKHPTPYDFHYSEHWRDDFTCALSGDEWQTWNDEKRLDGDLAGHITVLEQRGICLYGIPTADVFPEVPIDDYRDSILKDVLDPIFGVNSDLTYPAYVLLNACRTYAFLRTGSIFSKQEGGEWAMGELPKRFQPVLQAALQAYLNQRDDRSIDKQDARLLADYLSHLIIKYK